MPSKNLPSSVTFAYTWEFELAQGDWFTVEGHLYFDLEPAEPRSHDFPGCDADAQLTAVTVHEIQMDKGESTAKITAGEADTNYVLFQWIAAQLLEHADMEEMRDYCFDRIAENYEL